MGKTIVAGGAAVLPAKKKRQPPFLLRYRSSTRFIISMVALACFVVSKDLQRKRSVNLNTCLGRLLIRTRRPCTAFRAAQACQYSGRSCSILDISLARSLRGWGSCWVTNRWLACRSTPLTPCTVPCSSHNPHRHHFSPLPLEKHIPFRPW